MHYYIKIMKLSTKIRDLLWICFFVNWRLLGIHFGSTRGFFGFTRGLLLGSILPTEVCSRLVFYLTIKLPVIPNTTCSVCFHGFISDRSLLSVYTLGLRWVYSGLL